MCSEESKSNRCISDEHILLPFLDLQEGLSSKNNVPKSLEVKKGLTSQNKAHRLSNTSADSGDGS